MNIQDNTIRTTAPAFQQQLPPLKKGLTTYKLTVPRKVEEKIRYLIRKFPSTEWSGILFYSHTGTFEAGDLEICCKDIFPMDLGTGTFTDFKMDESVVGYIAENIDLFECDMGLVHSHHSMGAFISGTDSNTIRAEGNDTNCFVSLVVDTKGTYVAALTRKVREKKQVTTADMGTSYEFFGEGSINLADSHHKASTVEVVDSTVIEYFMLDVQIEQVDNPLAYLDARFDEIQEAKRKKTVPTVSPAIKTFGNDFDDDYSFHDWQNSKRKESAEAKEALLFSDDQVAGEIVDSSGWEPDPATIHDLVCKMVTCSLIIDTAKFDLKQWITRHMVKKYEEIFEAEDNSGALEEWEEFMVEFMVNRLMDTATPAKACSDWELLQSKSASAMYNELCQYPTNKYIEEYKEILTRYIYE